MQTASCAESSPSELFSQDLFRIGWGDSQLSSTPLRGQGFSVYVPDFFLKNAQPWVTFQQTLEVSLATLSSSLERYLVQFGVPLSSAAPSLNWEFPAYSSFKRVFEGIQEQISQGVLKKAVPTVFLHSKEKQQGDELLLQRALLIFQLLKNTQGSPVHLYGWWDAQGDGILGATPELLFSQSQQFQVQTMALAGTRLKKTLGQIASTEGEGALLDDPKERFEHQIVVDSICSSLRAWGDVKVGQTQELHLKTLSHLYTPIELSVSPNQKTHRQSDFLAWVKALHPTPALGAFPQEAGWEWLKTHDPLGSRVRFGAPFGVYFSEKRSFCLVAIRNIQWAGGQLMMGAGCGIVHSSQVEKEWREIHGKWQAIHRSFGFELNREAQFYE